MDKIEKMENSIEWKERFEQTTVDSLRRALSVHDNLGEAGEELVQKNQFGETALRVDIECEKAILDFLKETGVPIRVISEEHGQVDITENPRYLGILDGLDGSNVYKKERGRARYGTMFGIFNTVDPNYEDYLTSGIMEHPTKRLFIAQKNNGAFVVEGIQRTQIHSSDRTQLSPDVNIYIDEYFEINKDTFSRKLQDFKPTSRDFSVGSSAVHYVDVASGVADLALECTRKNNLEIAVAYGLETEAGAVMVDLEGVSIGDKKYLEFGQKEKTPIITAATRGLAEELLERIKSRV
ncbi:MAG: inositol monophosphatase family protein [Candidatus Spechtbacterales bacterium]